MTDTKQGEQRFIEKQLAKGREVFVPERKGDNVMHGTIHSRSEATSFSSVADFRRWCQSLVVRDATRKALETILADPTHPHFMQALRLVIEQGFGRTPQVVELRPASPDAINSCS